MLPRMNTAGSRWERWQARACAGSARLGVEALELKVLDGCGVTEIARLYDSKPNEVGAWLARAAKKIREDATDGELYALGARSA